MSENATVTTQENTATEQERTFTQDEVNAIIGKRLAEDRAKYADYETLKTKAAKFDEAEEAAKSELQKMTEKAGELQAKLDSLEKANEIRSIRDKVSKETGVPVNLLTGDTEEACMEQAKAIAEYAKPSSYPNVRDGGETRKTGGASTREQFKQWFDSSLTH